MDASLPREELVRRAAAGDRSALEEALRQLYPQVRAMVHRELETDFRRHHPWMLPLFSTGDIVQEVFLGVLKDLPRFEEREEGGLEGWLASMVRHRILDAVRRCEAMRRDRRREVAMAGESGEDPIPVAARDPTPSRVAEISEAMAAYRGLLQELPERERELLEHRLVRELPWKEVASLLGYPSDEAARFAFRQLRARLLVRLRALGFRMTGMPGDQDTGGGRR